MSVEQNKTKCKICNQVKDRILIGKFDTKNKKYADENNKLWSGLVCPTCHKDRIKSNMKAMRVLRKSLQDI